MNNYTIIIILSIVFLISCNNEQNEKQIDKTLLVESTNKQDMVFDWGRTKLLKQNLILELQSSEKADGLLISFLSDYDEVINENNNILFGLESYDSLNTIMNESNGVIYNNALEFKKQADSSGFSISSSEGMIYLAESTKYLKLDILPLLDSISSEFLKLYCNEIDNNCCDDAAIIISKEELVNRMYIWGEFSEKTKGLKYYSFAINKFNHYRSLVFVGTDNSPSFDIESGKYDKELLRLISNIINLYPDSKTANELKKYKDLLGSHNYKRTSKVDSFIAQKISIK